MLWAALLLMQGAAAVPPSADASACRREERYRECRRFRDARSYEGVWIDEFEGSRFIEGARSYDEARRRLASDAAVYWLDLDAKSEIAKVIPRRYGTAYRIRLTAREMLPQEQRSRFSLPGFGHMGMWHRSLLLDAIQSAEVIRVAPE
ncbi:MAG: hypothetical protein PGN16_03270 [Sphingomonas phyllosphaerae]|uniref:hypothetical protein n=1 Tax=Sphingomonas phyllosphaerae TaxID=257003 RepID=UPI002FFC3F24